MAALHQLRCTCCTPATVLLLRLRVPRPTAPPPQVPAASRFVGFSADNEPQDSSEFPNMPSFHNGLKDSALSTISGGVWPGVALSQASGVGGAPGFGTGMHTGAVAAAANLPCRSRQGACSMRAAAALNRLCWLQADDRNRLMTDWLTTYAYARGNLTAAGLLFNAALPHWLDSYYGAL